jgi:hypothetical protein
MEEKKRPHAEGIRMLTHEEMQKINGGGLLDYVLKIVGAGLSYCYHMGVQEGRRMRAQL